MVLSNKKLKRKLRAQAVEGGADAADKPKSTAVSERERKQQRSQQPQNPLPASPVSAIDQAELNTYDRCINAVLHKHDEEPNQNQETETKDSSDAIKSHKQPSSNGKSGKRKKTKERNPEIDQQPDKASDQSANDQDPSDPRTVYVGGIPYYSSEEDIKAFFGDCGTISEVKLKTFSDSGKFRGIALLTFKTVGGAGRALARDGANMGDRFLKVQRSVKPKESVKKELYNGPPSKTEGCTTAYIGNLPWTITEEDIRKFFKNCKVDSVRFSQGKITGDFQGFGHIDFADDQSLELALERDQEILLGRPVKVAYAVPKRNDSKAGKAGRERKDVFCYCCGEKGHVSSCCPYMGRGS